MPEATAARAEALPGGSQARGGAAGAVGEAAATVVAPEAAPASGAEGGLAASAICTPGRAAQTALAAAMAATALDEVTCCIGRELRCSADVRTTLLGACLHLQSSLANEVPYYLPIVTSLGEVAANMAGAFAAQ